MDWRIANDIDSTCLANGLCMVLFIGIMTVVYLTHPNLFSQPKCPCFSSSNEIVWVFKGIGGWEHGNIATCSCEYLLIKLIVANEWAATLQYQDRAHTLGMYHAFFIRELPSLFKQQMFQRCDGFRLDTNFAHIVCNRTKLAM